MKAQGSCSRAQASLYSRRSHHPQCSGALTPLLALSLGRTGQLMQSQLHPLARKFAKCGEAVLDLLALGPSFRLSSLLKALLLFLFSVLALAMSFTRYALGQAIAAKIEEVIASTGTALYHTLIC